METAQVAWHIGKRRKRPNKGRLKSETKERDACMRDATSSAIDTMGVYEQHLDFRVTSFCLLCVSSMTRAAKLSFVVEAR